MIPARSTFALSVTLILSSLALLQCSSSSGNGGVGDVTCSSLSSSADYTQDAGTCYPDNDGITGGGFTVQLDVDDTGFTATDVDAGAKNIIATQNDAQITLTLTNTGTKPHGFTVACVSVCSVYPTLPSGCSPDACFPAGSTIAPIMPGASATVTFDTPTPDGLLYPFASGAPGDSNVPGLNDGQWSLM
ncbi:MAG TPA: hypothetical protein VGL81_00460 [Polyangiaceae bacterium]|jgi:hypothetical protein